MDTNSTSRLSTAANLGILDDQTKAKEIAKANLALIQIQGVVVGGLAAIFALLVGWIPQLKYFSLFHLLSREPLEILCRFFLVKLEVLGLLFMKVFPDSKGDTNYEIQLIQR